jgi:hypothetical protein
MQYLSISLPETSEFNRNSLFALVQVRQAVVDYMLENEEDFVYFLAPATRPAYKKVGETVFSKFLEHDARRYHCRFVKTFVKKFHIPLTCELSASWSESLGLPDV